MIKCNIKLFKCSLALAKAKGEEILSALNAISAVKSMVLSVLVFAQASKPKYLTIFIIMKHLFTRRISFQAVSNYNAKFLGLKQTE